MFDGSSLILTHRRREEPDSAATLPWQLVALLISFAALSVVLAILYPEAFGIPMEQF